MKTLSGYIVAIVCAIALTGCTTATVRVQRVLCTSAALDERSPAGRRALATLEALYQWKSLESGLTNKTSEYVSYLSSTNEFLKKTNASLNLQFAGDRTTMTNNLVKQNVLVTVQTNAQEYSRGLTRKIAQVSERIKLFENFFSTNENNNMVGLAPRIDFEILRAKELLIEQTSWVRANCPSITNVDGLIPDAEDLIKEVNQAANDTEKAAATVSAQGFGGYVTVGIAEINASDPQYRKILTGGFLHLSPDSFSEATVDISGDANIIIVQESPGQFRPYQVSNDPSTLTKNISLLVSKATSAAAKYMSGGIAP